MNAFIIAVVGGSASGKTTLARDLVAALHPDAALLSLDAFYRSADHLPPGRRGRINFDHPRRIDWPLLSKVLDRAVAGRPAQVPRYAFDTHARLSDTERLLPSRFLVVEGLWLLRRRNIRSRCDLSVFVSCPSATRLKRRLGRDLAERGRTRMDVLKQWRHQTEPGFRRLVAPQRKLADLVVRSPVTRSQVGSLVRTIRRQSEDTR